MRQTATATPTTPPHAIVDACVGCRCPEAWDAFLRRFGPAVDRGVHSVLGRFAVAADPDLVDDLRQEVFCRLLDRDGRALRRCRGTEDHEVAAYLRRIASNVAVDVLRATSAEKRGLAVTRSAGGLAVQLSESVAHPRASADRRATVRAARRSFFVRSRQLLGARLGHRDAAMLYLAAFEGWSSPEIASRYGLSPAAVDSRLCRLRRALEAGGMQLPRRRRRPAG